jgi:hypothetical protein|tara:strand:- start:1037 stop:1225 length:189 start_codon:yes stop_codon:yes gene_type:complete
VGHIRADCVLVQATSPENPRCVNAEDESTVLAVNNDENRASREEVVALLTPDDDASIVAMEA